MNQSNMLAYTSLDIEEVKDIMHRFVDDDINSFEALSGGSENSNFHIYTQTAEYVLTICENKTKEEAYNLAKLLAHLNNNGFSTSTVIKTKQSDLVSIWNSKPILLKRFINGKIIPDLQAPLIFNIGMEMAKLHKVPPIETVPNKFGYGIQHFDELKELGFDNEFTTWLQHTKHYILENLDDSLPKSLIHGDVFYSNVIISENEELVTIMDFEEACYYYRVFDIGMAIVGLCTVNDSIIAEKARMLIDGYNSLLKLSKVEIAKLRCFTIYAATATAFWRFKHFNHTIEDSGMNDHYLEMQLIAKNAKTAPFFHELIQVNE